MTYIIRAIKRWLLINFSFVGVFFSEQIVVTKKCCDLRMGGQRGTDSRTGRVLLATTVRPGL